MDIVPGTEAGLRLYLNEIVRYLERAITSPSWKLKAQSASAIGSIAKSIKSQLEPSQRDTLIQIILNGLAGRTWEGKEHLLHALAALCAVQSEKETFLKGEEIFHWLLNDGHINFILINITNIMF